MITWIIDQHVDKLRGAATPFLEIARARGHIVHGLRDSILPMPIDLTNISVASPCVVRGSHGFVNYVHKELSPQPGAFVHESNFQLSNCHPDILPLTLNANHQVVTYGDFLKNRSKFTGALFVKPLEEMKLFNGLVIPDQQDIGHVHFEKYRKWFNPDHDVKLLVSPAVQIDAEYRVVVVNKQVITASTYPMLDAEVPDHVIRSAQVAANIWSPMPVYVLDIAVTDRGNKIVEYNQFGTSAMYACDQEKIIQALENYFQSC